MADIYNYVDEDSVRRVLNDLSLREDVLGQRVAAQLQKSLRAWEGPIQAADVPSPMQVLSQTVMMANLVPIAERRDYLYSLNMLAWGRTFVAEILHNLRDLICGTKRRRGELGEKSKALLAALATLIAHRFHVDSGFSVALATLLLIALGKATKKAFCKMTDEEVLNALGKE